MAATELQSIAVLEYSGPQGSFELSAIESANLSRSTTRTRAKTMKRDRRPIGFQSGTEDVSLTLTVIPELIAAEVDWLKAFRDGEVFLIVAEKGLDGIREQIQDCMVAGIDDTWNENGEARTEVTIESLASVDEPS